MIAQSLSRGLWTCCCMHCNAPWQISEKALPEHCVSLLPSPRARKGYRIAGRFLQLVTYPPFIGSSALLARCPLSPLIHLPSSTSSTSRRHYGRHHARGQSIKPAANKCKGLIRREVENAVLHSAAGGCHFSYDLQLSRMEVT